MPALPLISNFQGDFVLQLVVADSAGTIDELVDAAAVHSVGKRVAPQPGKIVRVRKQGSTEFYGRNVKLDQTDIKPMDCLEFIFSDPE